MKFLLQILHSVKALLLSTQGKWIAIFLILIVNVGLYNIIGSKGFTDAIQSRKDASGFSIESGQEFVYFYYYTDYFPLASLNKNKIYNKEAAYQEIKDEGENLVMEYKQWTRFGENGRIWAFLPNAIMKGSPENPSIRLFNSTLFTLSLIILFIGFYRIGFPLIGAIIVFAINFTPYFIYEVYANENIFSLLASTFFIVLGTSIHLLFRREHNLFKSSLLLISLSVYIACISEIRNEISIVIASLLLIVALAQHFKYVPKFILIILCISTFVGSKIIIQSNFDDKFNTAYKVVEKNGGHLYNGNRVKGHTLWHPIFCGLGDYDTKYGYAWNDKVAYNYAVPILKEKYSIDIDYSGEYSTNNYYDDDELYYVKLEEIEEYEEIVKDKVLSDIKNDPLWYIEIILKRMAKVLSTTIPIPYIGWTLIPLLLLLIKKRKWIYINLIIVSLPLSLSSVLIYSGRGISYNSVFVYMILIVALLLYKDSKSLKNNLQANNNI